MANRSAMLIALIICTLRLIPDPISAAPITVPNMNQCELAQEHSAVGPPQSLTLNCCLPITGKVVDFSFDNYPVKDMHIRRAAHTVSESYIAKYNLAYERMRALPPEDPRSMAVQANIHCAFCAGAFVQGGAGGNVTLQVHFSWLFLPWHRWYLYFHERILGSLIDDPGFSLVYWNWDDQSGDGGNMMPDMFARNGTAIWDDKRDLSHLPPFLVRLSPLQTSTNNSVVANENLNSMYQTMVTANAPELFAGGAYRLGTDVTNSSVINAPLGGSLENAPHNGIHYWTGNKQLTLLQDMGTFSTAGRDPIFYSHHTNVDRLWDVWQNHLPGGKRPDHNDPDFLNAEFVFYDEHANMVKVKVKDALDVSKLGIMYKKAKSDDLWINYSPPPLTNTSAIPEAIAIGVPVIESAPTNGTINVGSRLVGIVSRPSGKKPSKLNEVLIIQGLDVVRNNFSQLVVFVNLPYANATTVTSSAEYVGTFNIIPTMGKHKHLHANAKFEIGDNIKRIGLQKEEDVVITIVAKGSDTITIEGLKINYE